jgi:N-methylhydantoinase A
MALRVGVDIGGTFTDIVLRLPDGSLRVSKVSSTPEDPGLAVVNGLAALLRTAEVKPRDVVEIVHGTTVASNTILQKTGAVTGLITTRGFRDVLEIGRVRTPDLYDLTWEKPLPLVPRRLRLEVDERTSGWRRRACRSSRSASSTATRIPRTSRRRSGWCGSRCPAWR